MVPLQALRAVGGRERQRRVVTTELREPGAPLRHGRPEPGDRWVGGGPAQQRRHEVALGHFVRVVGWRHRLLGAQRRPEPAEGGEGTTIRRPGRVARAHGLALRAVQQPVQARILDGEREVGRAERDPEVERGDHRDQQLAVGPGEHRAGRVVRRPRGHRPPDTDDIVGGIGGEDEASARPRAGQDPLGEPLAIVLDEAHGAGDDRWRASVVGLEVHPPQARQRGGQPEDSPHVGETPRVHRLVVVADQEDVVRGRGQQQRQLQLGSVQVLGLVHQQPRGARPPAGEQARVRLQSLERAHQQVVEVETARIPDGALVGDEGAGDRPGRRVPRHLVRRDAQVQLEPREREVQPPAVRPRDAGEQVTQHRVPVRERLHGHARVAEDLPARGRGTSGPAPSPLPRPTAPVPRPGVPSAPPPRAC